MASIQCAKCKGVHASVAEVRQCHNVAAPPEFVAPSVDNSYVVGSASPKIYLDAPYKSREVVKEAGARWDGAEKKWWVTKEVWDLKPEFWKAYEFKDRSGEPTPEPIQEGWYNRDGTIYQVVLSKTGNPYAKVLRVNMEKKGNQVGTWDYAPGAVADLKPEMLMSLENQCEYGQLYSICVRCGRRLTKEESKARGMGDICAENVGM